MIAKTNYHHQHYKKKFPKHKYVGVDFNLKNAKETYPEKIEWIEGYALDVIPSISPDLVFSSSTWMIFNPGELNSYIEMLKSIGCKDVMISEPSWGSPYIYNEEKLESFHLEEAIWLHNWPAYFIKHGYLTSHIDNFPYQPSRTTRFDLRMVLGHWSSK